MWYPAEISLASYLPLELEVGMLFINRISVGVIEPYIELFELEEVPGDMNEFMSKHGAPVEIYIIDQQSNLLAYPEEVGWWDEGDSADEFRDITLNDINYLLRELDGYVDILVEDDEEEFAPVIYDDRVVLSLVADEDDEWDEILDEEWNETLNDGLED
jgi:hypothetical protein